METMENVVTAIFDVEAEAYKAFAEIRQMPAGKGYSVVEAALLKREGDAVIVADAIDAAAVTSDDTTTGAIVGALVGILGGPLGVLLGAGAGALIGSAFDSADAVDSASMLEVASAKLYDGETAIIALVREEEPAFDAAFEGYKTIIVRHYAVDVVKEVQLAREATADMANQLKEQLRAERKAEKAEQREQRKADVQARVDDLKAAHDDRKAELKSRVDELKAEHAERKATFEEGKEIANAQFTSATNEMLGKE